MSNLPVYGNFDGLNLPKWDREMIQSGFAAVESVEGGWEFLRTFTPPADKGFMFTLPTGKHKEIDEAISNRYGGHSGASYACTMRVLEFIAKNGWDAYARKMLLDYGPPAPPLIEQAKAVDNFLATKPPTHDLVAFATALQQDPEMRRLMPDIDEQTDALKRFKEGKLSYAEMRSLCG